MAARSRATTRQPVKPDWYRDAVIYEVHVRSFFDSSGDGVGDFRGLTRKLDYLADLGVTAIWLLPFYPSPLRDDGYDIADYESVNPAYGSLRDAETFIREAHRRGLRVITELVCNHTSDQHPWFQRARRAPPGSTWRNYYVWSDDPGRYREARIIFKDFETSNWTWDPVAGAYYWHRFYSHQPDLNFDNRRVQGAIVRAMEFWLDRGVDGLRLDAVPYLYEREGTDCENLPETHAFLRELRRHVDERYGDRMLLAEANQWPEQSAAYFGDGDECHMAFHFPVMPRLFMALRMEDRLPVVDIMEQTPPIPEGAQWALFLRNHDELTLEMVTDEERDYMYRVYADDPRARINMGIRRRLAPLLGNHRRRIELMNGLLFSLPGTPVIYYGDEIGMGDNVTLGDRDSVRTPMQWTGEVNAGFSTAAPERLYLPVVADPQNHYEAVNVAAAQSNPHSLLWWMKRLIALNKSSPAFGRGSLEFVYPENRHILAFLRRLDGEVILVVANLSRFFQPFALDLGAFADRRPVEMFGRVEFPPIRRGPYPLTLGPHEFLWLALEPVESAALAGPAAVPPLAVGDLADLRDGAQDRALARVLLRWVEDRPWYRGLGRRPKGAEVVDRIGLPLDGAEALLAVLSVTYTEGDPDTYLVPLTTATLGGDSLVFADGLPCHVEPPGLRIASLVGIDGRLEGRFLVDASADVNLTAALVDAIARRRRLRGRHGELAGKPGPGLRATAAADIVSAGGMLRAGEAMGAPASAEPGAVPSAAEQASVTGQAGAAGTAPRGLTLELRFAFETGADPEVELMGFLAGRGAAWAPRVFGELEYRPRPGAVGAAALLRESLPHHGDAVAQAHDSLLAFLELAATREVPSGGAGSAAADLVRAAGEELPPLARELLGDYLEIARSIGERIGEFHAILASSRGDGRFDPEPFTRHYQASLFQAVDTAAVRVARQVRTGRRGRAGITPADRRLLLDLRGELKVRLDPLLVSNLGGSRTRIHGAMRLAEVMQGERGIVLIDFEGDTSRPASERRIKRSSLRDVASMILSFGDVALGRPRPVGFGGILRPEDAPTVEAWSRRWHQWVATAFLRGYRESTAGAEFLPTRDDAWVVLLDAFLLQGRLDDLYRALRTDPGAVTGSMRGLREVLGG